MYAEKIAQAAEKALLLEVYATPKPGLVDRNNTGAHQDMDLAMFEKSAAALRPHFALFAHLGMEADGLCELFCRLRPAGMKAEEDMLRVTGGVNTHKGALFSIGLLCAAAGFCQAKGKRPTPQLLCATVAEMTKGLCQRELYQLSEGTTHGEKVFLRHRATGVRGEAESGFASVLRFGLPEYRRQAPNGQNRAAVAALLSLIANTDDTNVLSRRGGDALRWLQNRAKEVLSSFSEEEVLLLDLQCIEQNISPGGCADLLSCVIFLDLICK